MTLVLASSSPRRRILLRLLVDDFEVHPADIDEEAPHRLPIPDALRVIARKKALAVGADRPDDWILAADTVVVLDGELIGKSQNEAEERLALARLSGHRHEVVTGLALVWGDEVIDDADVTTRLRMDRLPGPLVQRYVASGAWQGKAGGYGIQDALLRGHVHIEAGAWSNVVGLPLAATAHLLRRNGIAVMDPPAESAVATQDLS